MNEDGVRYIRYPPNSMKKHLLYIHKLLVDGTHTYTLKKIVWLIMLSRESSRCGPGYSSNLVTK